jgi:beta-galactosidase
MPDGMPSLRPPRIDLPYLISEAVGTIVGPPFYRRVDAQHVQAAQPLLHAAVHNVASSDDRYCGLLAWCGFDYPSGWYHTFQGIKWPGVYDIFRTGKLGAAFYRAQVDPSIRVVIEPGFHWGMGVHYQWDKPKRTATIYSNCDTLVLTVDGRETRTLQPDTENFEYLRYPPFRTDLVFPDRTPSELRIDGYLAGQLALTRQFAADTSHDRLFVRTARMPPDSNCAVPINTETSGRSFPAMC